eukprot:scaffold133532_cov26-Tisochrysis_lutea.AAC.2
MSVRAAPARAGRPVPRASASVSGGSTASTSSSRITASACSSAAAAGDRRVAATRACSNAPAETPSPGAWCCMYISVGSSRLESESTKKGTRRGVCGARCAPAPCANLSSCFVHAARTSLDELSTPPSRRAGRATSSTAAASASDALEPSLRRTHAEHSARHAASAAVRTLSLMSSSARISLACSSARRGTSSSCVRPGSSSASARQAPSRARHRRSPREAHRHESRPELPHRARHPRIGVVRVAVERR